VNNAADPVNDRDAYDGGEWDAAGERIEREEARRYGTVPAAIVGWAATVTVSVLDTLEGA